MTWRGTRRFVRVVNDKNGQTGGTASSRKELKLHGLRGLANGLTKEEIGEIVTQLTPYVGFPLSVSAATALGKVIPRADVSQGMANPDAP